MTQQEILMSDVDTGLNPFAQILTESEDNSPEMEEEETPEEESEEELEEVAEEEPQEIPDDLTNDGDIFPEDIAQLAEAFEVDEDKIRDIKVAHKKDGSDVTLGQVISNWDISEAVNRKSQEVSELKKSLETERAQALGELGQKLQEQNTIIDALENLYSSIGDEELEELRVSDPAEYAARKADMSDRKRNLNIIRTQVQQEQEQLQQEAMKQQQMWFQQKVMEEAKMLQQKSSDLTSQKDFENEYTKVSKYLQEVGYTPEELSGLYDHRMMLLARDAMRYHTVDKTAKPKKV